MEQQNSIYTAIQRIGSFCVALALALTLLPGGFADPVPVSASGTINVSSLSGPQTLSSGDWVITGSTTNTNARIVVPNGFNGTITLQNLSIRHTGLENKNNSIVLDPNKNSVDYAPIWVQGPSWTAGAGKGASNLSPSTKVELILEGSNNIYTDSQWVPAIQVDQGAQITISSIDEEDDTSGRLIAQSSSDKGNSGSDGSKGKAAAIGAPGCNGTSSGTLTDTTKNGSWGPQGQIPNSDWEKGTGSQNSSINTAGGNIIISSGTITAHGSAHGAGIGGGHFSVYTGNILIYGGVVESHGGYHSAGIGTGCPSAGGNNGAYAHESSIVVLPSPTDPSKPSIKASSQQGKPGLAGAQHIVYIGDSQSPLVKVHTETNEKDASIYADLTLYEAVTDIIDAIAGNAIDMSKISFGKTGSDGFIQFRGTLNNPVTFYTDATSTKAGSVGVPFMPESATAIGDNKVTETVTLPLLKLKLSLTDISSIPLDEGYSRNNANENAYKIEVSYDDTEVLDGIQVAFQGNPADVKFREIGIYSDLACQNPISLPSEISNGQKFYIHVPLKDNMPANLYQNTLTFKFKVKGAASDVLTTIYKVPSQMVVKDDSNYKNIHVDADIKSFVTNAPNTKSVKLTTWIKHDDDMPEYSQATVEAKYIITTKEKYSEIAENDSGWTKLDAPLANDGTAETSASFNGKTDATYYIHWKVKSGSLSAHSRDFTAAEKPYGAYGPYIVDMKGPEPTITFSEGDPTSKTINNFNEISIKINFDEPLKAYSNLLPASFTVSDNRGTISNIQEVSGKNRMEFTATLTPSQELAHGDTFTVNVEAGKVTDEAGNGNAVSGNITVTVNIGNAKPVISFAVDATTEYSLRPKINVTLNSGDKGVNNNTILSVAKSPFTSITNGTWNSHPFTITKKEGNLSVTNFTVAYAAGDPNTAVITFTGDLDNSKEYTVSIPVNRVYNKLGNANDFTEFSFTVKTPEITKVEVKHNATQAQQVNLEPAGGNVIIVVTGSNLDRIPGGKITIKRNHSLPNLEATVTSPTTATTAAVNLPQNDTNQVISYTFTEDYSPVTKQVGTAHVLSPNPSVTILEHNKAVPPAMIPYTGAGAGTVTFTLKGGNMQGATALEIRQRNSINKVDINPSTIALPGTLKSVVWTPALPENTTTSPQTYIFDVWMQVPGGSLEPTTATASIIVAGKPEVTSITPATSTIAYDGGANPILTINGANLNQISGGKITVNVRKDGSSQTPIIVPIPSTATTSVTFKPNLPENNTNAPIKYTFEEQFNSPSEGKAAITVNPPIPEITGFTATPDTLGYQGGSTKLTITGKVLHGATKIAIKHNDSTPVPMTLPVPSSGVQTITYDWPALPANDTTTPITHTFTVEVTASGTVAGNNSTATVTVAGKPAIKEFVPGDVTLDQFGDLVTISLDGVNLRQISGGTVPVTRTNPDGSTKSLTALVVSDTNAVFSDTVPENEELTDKVYVYTVTDATLVATTLGPVEGRVTVAAAVPSLGDGSGSALSADPDFIENDDMNFAAGSTTLTIRGANLHNYSALEVRCDDGRVFTVNPASSRSPGVTIRDRNREVTIPNVEIPHNPDAADKPYNFTVFAGENGSPATETTHKAQVTAQGAYPAVSSVTAEPDAHSSAGGFSLFTLAGRYLHTAEPLTLVDSLGGTHEIPKTDIVDNGRKATITLGFSGNVGRRNDIHVLEAHIDGNATGQMATVEVGDSVPFVEDADATPMYFTEDDTKYGRGRSTITIYGGYILRAQSLSIRDVINRTTYEVSRVDNDINTHVVTVPSNRGVYRYEILLNGEDTGVFVEIGVGDVPLGYSDPERPETGKPSDDEKEWTGRGGVKGRVFSGDWAWTGFDLLYHHARQAVKKDPENPVMSLWNVWVITQKQLNRAASGARADTPATGRVTIHFDTMEENDNTAVEGRLILDPLDANFIDGHLYPMVFTRQELTGKTEALFRGRFDNSNIEVIRLSQVGTYNMRVEIVAYAELDSFDTDNLYFYLYVPETGEYSRIAKPDYSIGEDGALHFFTEDGGDIIVTDKPLTQSGKAFQPGSFPVDRKQEDDSAED